jgi:hypothetical protein
MPPQGSQRACRLLLRDQEILAQDAGNLNPGQLFLSGEIGALVLGAVLTKRRQHTDLEIFVRQLVDFGDAVSDQNCVVGDAFKLVWQRACSW